MKKIKTIVVEDVPLELKGTLSIIRTDIPEIEIVGTAQTERDFWKLMDEGLNPSLVLLDLGLGGSTTVGVDICRRLRSQQPNVRVLVFTGELSNEKLWADVIAAGAAGLILKTGEMLTREHVLAVVSGSHCVFSQQVIEVMAKRFCQSVRSNSMQSQSIMTYEIDEYDERLLRHLALGYTKDMISELPTMPFSSKSIEKRQTDLIARLFPDGEQRGINAARLVTRAIELHIIDPENLTPDA